MWSRALNKANIRRHNADERVSLKREGQPLFLGKDKVKTCALRTSRCYAANLYKRLLKIENKMAVFLQIEKDVFHNISRKSG